MPMKKNKTTFLENRQRSKKILKNKYANNSSKATPIESRINFIMTSILQISHNNIGDIVLLPFLYNAD